MEARPKRENSCGALMDFLFADMGCNRVELKSVCSSDLGSHKAGSRACTKIPFRCVVRLVRSNWNTTFQAKGAQRRSLIWLVTCYESISRSFDDGVIRQFSVVQRC